MLQAVAPQVDWGYVADGSVLRASFLNLTSYLHRYFRCRIRVGLGGNTSTQETSTKGQNDDSDVSLFRGLNIEYIEFGPFC